MGNGSGWSRPEWAGAGHAVEILWPATWAVHTMMAKHAGWADSKVKPGWAARKIKKGEGKEEAGWAGLRFQLGFGPLPNRNQ
jgi:hypothetical protein